MQQKGISLPVNVIVIVAIGILVLIVVAGFFVQNTGEGFSQFELQSAKSTACSNLKTVTTCADATGQDLNTVKVKVSEKIGSKALSWICAKSGVVNEKTDPISKDAVTVALDLDQIEACIAQCGCPAATTTTTLRVPGGNPPAAGLPPGSGQPGQQPS